ncbi:unnamed protein product, partial [Nesidiocoris tenuis]
ASQGVGLVLQYHLIPKTPNARDDMNHKAIDQIFHGTCGNRTHNSQVDARIGDEEQRFTQGLIGFSRCSTAIYNRVNGKQAIAILIILPFAQDVSNCYLCDLVEFKNF